MQADSPQLQRSFLQCCVACEGAGSSCMSACALQLLSWPSAGDVLGYFYSPMSRSRFRLPGCNESSRRARGGPFPRVGADLVWDPLPGQICLWTNMPFSKLVAIVLFMRALEVTHVIESGRMGGLSLVHYGFLGVENLVSVELFPVPGIRTALQSFLPNLTMHDGDGSVLVPRAARRILAREPKARIAVILDGPKGAPAVNLALGLLSKVALVVLDDQCYTPKAGKEATGRNGLFFQTREQQWRLALPLKRDSSLVDPFSARFYFPAKDCATILFGDNWQGRARELTDGITEGATRGR
jgi:hypothetical protein